jgi:hypothetical protein
MFGDEARNLKAVEKLIPLVPQLVGTAQNAPILVMTPVGKPFCFGPLTYGDSNFIPASRFMIV